MDKKRVRCGWCNADRKWRGESEAALAAHLMLEHPARFKVYPKRQEWLDMLK